MIEKYYIEKDFFGNTKRLEGFYTSKSEAENKADILSKNSTGYIFYRVVREA